jgi:hypothetical protein
MFFVGTAPLAAEGHVNLSPKGHREQTFAILSDNQVAYLDMTGSGIETLAHIKVRAARVGQGCLHEAARVFAWGWGTVPLRLAQPACSSSLENHSQLRCTYIQALRLPTISPLLRLRRLHTCCLYPKSHHAIQENGRITFMFCSFEGSPCIMRLYGRAVAHELGTPEFEDIVARAFPAAAPVDGDAGPGDAPAAPAGVIGPHPGFAAGARSVIVADIYEVASACGYAVPLMEFKEERDSLVTWSAKKGQEAIEEYRRGHATSLDGLRGLNIAPGPAVGAT